MLMFERAALFGVFGAMGATIDFAAGLDSVADDVTIAMFALRRERVDRTLKAVERVAPAAQLHFEGFVIVISTDFTACHGFVLHTVKRVCRKAFLAELCASAMPRHDCAAPST
jgi:hypothetical protein